WSGKAKGEPLFLKTDTHWSPRGLAIAADAITAQVRAKAERLPALTLTSRNEQVTAHGDLFGNLFNHSDGLASFPDETVTVTRVIKQDGGSLNVADDNAKILLLGDSYTNIYDSYDSEYREWGQDAGLGQQLMLRLATPVEVIAQNGGGAVEVRE